MVQQLDFDDRLRKLGRKHRAMSNGYETYMHPDGLIVARPVPQRARVPLRIPVFLIVGVIAFKAFLMAALGPQTYDDRVLRLQQGTMVERLGAAVMQREPVSQYLAERIGPILR